MDELEKKLKNLPLEDVPKSFHVRVIDYISDKKLKTPFYFLITLLSLNFVASLWSFIYRMIEQESLEAVRASFEGFEFSGAFMSDLWQTIKESLPGHALVLFLINLAILIYFIYLVFTMKSMNRKGRIINN